MRTEIEIHNSDATASRVNCTAEPPHSPLANSASIQSSINVNSRTIPLIRIEPSNVIMLFFPAQKHAVPYNCPWGSYHGINNL